LSFDDRRDGHIWANLTMFQRTSSVALTNRAWNRSKVDRFAVHSWCCWVYLYDVVFEPV